MLHLRNVATGADRVLARLPSRDVYAAPGSIDLAYVLSGRGPRRGGDFVEDPRLFLFDPFTGRRDEVGSGHSPLWHARGRLLAFLRPVGDRRCLAERCVGRAQVVALDLDTRRAEVVLPAGRWGLLGWAGNSLLVAGEDDLGRIEAVARDGTRRSIPVAPSRVWDASPDGRWLATAEPGGIGLSSLGADRLSGARVVSLDGTPADGAWAPDSSKLAAVVLSQPRNGRVVLVAVPGRFPRSLSGSRGAVGNVVWSSDGSALAFAAVAGRGGQRLKAVHCRLVNAPRCRALFSWSEGVLLLGLR